MHGLVDKFQSVACDLLTTGRDEAYLPSGQASEKDVCASSSRLR